MSRQIIQLSQLFRAQTIHQVLQVLFPLLLVNHVCQVLVKFLLLRQARPRLLH